ncbi:MAG: CehA/McbA family metallohydrolase [Woeseia sp.]
MNSAARTGMQAVRHVPGFTIYLVLLCTALAATARAAPPSVHTINSAGDDTLPGCGRCTAGDYVVRTGRIDAVIGGSHRLDESFYKFPTADALGSLVFLRPAGSGVRGDIMAGTPYLRIGNTTRHVRYDTLETRRDKDGVTFIARGQYVGEGGEGLAFTGRTTFVADSNRVELTLTVTNTGEKPVTGLVYSLFFDPHQIYDFSPADVAAHSGLQFRAYPRDGHLYGWLDRTARHDDDYNHSGWDGGMILPDPLAVTLAPGGSDRRRYTLLAGADDRQVLHDIYRDVDVATRTVTLDIVSSSTNYMELVVRDTDTTAIFYRTFLDRPAPHRIELPDGRYTVRANFFPGITQCELAVAGDTPNRCRLQDPPSGRLQVRLVDANGAPVPGKVTFEGIDGTPTPYFRPHNPSRDDGYWESHKNSVFPVHNEQHVTLPAGAYRVSAMRGPEFSLDRRTVQVAAGKSQALTLHIDRVIERPDLVAMDSHLHTLESDGAVDVAEKIRAVVAAGIDVAVATDHNFPVDYGPELEALGLADELTVLAGAEVTVPERLDYNSYPMTVEPDAPNHGAINALSTDLGSRFAASRARDPGVILQVNHPNSWQFDYFKWHALDPVSAAHALEGLDLSFDVLEVVNGAIYDTPNNEATRRDWFNLLRRGYFFPLVGTSDSHEIDRDEPGYSRTWIYRSDSPGTPLDVDALMQQVRAGHSFASNGPILDLTVGGRYRPGDTASVADGTAQIVVDILTAPWMEASTLRLYVNGTPQDLHAMPVPHPTATHLRATTALRLSRDTYVVAEVRGTSDLAPVVQRRRDAHGAETPVLPYALTNPVFIDSDGDGRFDPPLPREIRLIPHNRPH